MRLATELVESGVNTVLDKWDLKEGDESTAFMEKMVSDETVTKVIIISDKVYAEKSNKRQGGAGTEAQIISKEIFSQEDQRKFVVAVTEKDEAENAFTPSYYTSRIFIDFTDESKYSASFEQMIRWIEGKPLNAKPKLGTLPAYITEKDTIIELTTGPQMRRAIESLRASHSHAYAATKEYLEVFSAEIGQFAFEDDYDRLSDEVLRNFASFIPYRDGWLEVLNAICNYSDDPRFGELLHQFFERIIPYSFSEHGFEIEADRDNIKFFAQEMLLHSVALFVKEKRWDLLNSIISTPYFYAGWGNRSDGSLGSFREFNSHLKLLYYRQEQLKKDRWLSPAGQLFKERSVGSGFTFDETVQADFILFIRSQLDNNDVYDRWFPTTLVYAGRHRRAFEVFERSRSTAYFEKMRPMLGNATKDQLLGVENFYKENPNYVPKWDFDRVDVSGLLGIENLCTLN